MIFLLLLGSFVVGSIPTGWIIAASKGIDLRTVGSGNIGATNVLREVGKRTALVTLIADMAKGALPIWLVRTLFPEAGLPGWMHGIVAFGITIAEPKTALECAIGLAAILGHNFSIFLRFRGGKGIATSLGATFALSPHVALLSAAIWLLTLRWSGYSSLSALAAFGVLPLSIYIVDYSSEKLAFAVIVAVLAYLRHLGNIKRLLSGTECRVLRKTQ